MEGNASISTLTIEIYILSLLFALYEGCRVDIKLQEFKSSKDERETVLIDYQPPHSMAGGLPKLKTENFCNNVGDRMKAPVSK